MRYNSSAVALGAFILANPEKSFAVVKGDVVYSFKPTKIINTEGLTGMEFDSIIIDELWEDPE